MAGRSWCRLERAVVNGVAGIAGDVDVEWLYTWFKSCELSSTPDDRSHTLARVRWRSIPPTCRIVRKFVCLLGQATELKVGPSNHVLPSAVERVHNTDRRLIALPVLSATVPGD